MMNKKLKESISQLARSELEEDHFLAANLVWNSFSIELKKSIAKYVIRESLIEAFDLFPDFRYIRNLHVNDGWYIFQSNFSEEIYELILDFVDNSIENAKP